MVHKAGANDSFCELVLLQRQTLQLLSFDFAVAFMTLSQQGSCIFASAYPWIRLADLGEV